MGSDSRGLGADVLLDLDGQVLIVDPKGNYWVRFSVERVAPSTERPHGLRYSLTLHAASGERIIGYDNAHAVRRSGGPAGGQTRVADHRHRLGTVWPYRFIDAATLLDDFWADVDKVLRQKGVI